MSTLAFGHCSVHAVGAQGAHAGHHHVKAPNAQCGDSAMPPCKRAAPLPLPSILPPARGTGLPWLAEAPCAGFMHGAAPGVLQPPMLGALGNPPTAAQSSSSSGGPSSMSMPMLGLPDATAEVSAEGGDCARSSGSSRSSSDQLLMGDAAYCLPRTAAPAASSGRADAQCWSPHGSVLTGVGGRPVPHGVTPRGAGMWRPPAARPACSQQMANALAGLCMYRLDTHSMQPALPRPSQARIAAADAWLLASSAMAPPAPAPAPAPAAVQARQERTRLPLPVEACAPLHLGEADATCYLAMDLQRDELGLLMVELFSPEDLECALMEPSLERGA